MGEDISYDYIWNLFQKEKQTNQLLQLSKTFYTDILEYLQRFNPHRAPEGQHGEDTVNLFEKRKQKLFLYMAYNKPPPTQLDNSEAEFYNDLLKITEKYRIDPTKKIKSNKLLRSITDIPEIILPSGKKLGPLKKNEILDMLGLGGRHNIPDKQRDMRELQ